MYIHTIIQHVFITIGVFFVSNPRKYVRNAGVRPLLIGHSPGYGFAGVLQVTHTCAFLIGGQAGAGLCTHGCVTSDWKSADQ